MVSNNTNQSTGYVYILINSSMPGVVKIGKTTKDPNVRAAELSSATGVATPFLLVYSRKFKDCHLAERLTHDYLTKHNYRLNNAREFFTIDTTSAIDVIMSIPDNDVDARVVIASADEDDNSNLGEYYYIQGNKFLLGDDCFQDKEKAFEYWVKAADCGYVLAYFDIALMYETYFLDIKKAIDTYVKGGQMGDLKCYCRLAKIYMIDPKYKNSYNADMAFDLFYTNMPIGYVSNLNILCYDAMIDHIVNLIERGQINEYKYSMQLKTIARLYKDDLIRTAEKACDYSQIFKKDKLPILIQFLDNL